MSIAGSVFRALRPVARPVLRPAAPARLFQPVQGIRQSSHSPLGSSSSPARKKVTLPTLMSLYRKNEPITVITAHDFPSAHVADQAGIDMVLVGDSLAMVALGMDDTSEVLMEEMLLHCRSVARGAKSAFLVCDSPSLFPLLLCPPPLTTKHRSATSPWAPTKSHPTKRSNPQSP
jgi:3-methyl-2-oxobutanoate hydroxymethyltransferase